MSREQRYEHSPKEAREQARRSQHKDRQRKGPEPPPVDTSQTTRGLTGGIKKLILDKGFGFIRGDNGVEYFFHKSAVMIAEGFESLREGERVKFTAIPSAKGPRAQDVCDEFPEITMPPAVAEAE